MDAIIIIGAVVDVFVITNIMTDNGASFCHVDRINAECQEMDAIIDGYQVWQGAIPVFTIKASKIIEYAKSVIGVAVYKYILPMSNSLDPRA